MCFGRITLNPPCQGSVGPESAAFEVFEFVQSPTFCIPAGNSGDSNKVLNPKLETR